MLAEEAAGGTPALLISEDDGRTWQPLAADPRSLITTGSWPVFLGTDGWWPERIVAVVPGAMYAVAVRQSDVTPLLPSALLALLRSVDGGIHWTEVQLPRPSR